MNINTTSAMSKLHCDWNEFEEHTPNTLNVKIYAGPNRVPTETNAIFWFIRTISIITVQSKKMFHLKNIKLFPTSIWIQSAFFFTQNKTGMKWFESFVFRYKVFYNDECVCVVPLYWSIRVRVFSWSERDKQLGHEWMLIV